MGAQWLEFLGAKFCGQGGREMVTDAHSGFAPSKLLVHHMYTVPSLFISW